MVVTFVSDISMLIINYLNVVLDVTFNYIQSNIKTICVFFFRTKLIDVLFFGFRAGVVLGKDGGMIKQLWLPFSLGLGGPIGSGAQYLPWIHIDDLVNLILFAIEKPDLTGILNGVAPNVSFKCISYFYVLKFLISLVNNFHDELG